MNSKVPNVHPAQDYKLDSEVKGYFEIKGHYLAQSQKQIESSNTFECNTKIRQPLSLPVTLHTFSC